MATTSPSAAGARGQQARALLGSLFFLVVVPGTVAGWVPYWLTGWRAGPMPPGGLWLRVFGAALVIAGLASLVESFVRFAVVGLGTPAPIAPPERLVVSGQYRYVRNPMYVAVVAVILGQAAILARVELLAYAGLVWLIVHLFVVLYEERTLAARFAVSFAEYRRHVRRWVPRLRPWRG